MNMITSTFGALALCLMASACATHETARLDSRSALASPTDAHRAAVAAARSAYWGDNWTAANLLERANVHGNNVVDRFNLAATYQATGRLKEAAALYRGVEAEGWSKRVITSPINSDRTRRSVRFNLGEESAARVAYIEQQLAQSAALSAVASSAVRSAESAGIPASAIVGASARGRVSDEAAIARDASDQPLY